MALILVADDEESLHDILRRALAADDHQIESAHNGLETLFLLRKRRPDLVILDIAMPYLDGIGVCRQMRADPGLASIPILFLTARAKIEDKIKGFEAGCDDYLVKPFHLAELRLRLRALLRRRDRNAPQASLEAGALSLDPETFEVHIGDRTAVLTPVEFDLLSYLIAHAGEVISTSRLLQEVWGYPPGAGNRGLVRMHIKNLRRKIEASSGSPMYIQTVSRHGYTIRCPATSSAPESRPSGHEEPPPTLPPSQSKK